MMELRTSFVYLNNAVQSGVMGPGCREMDNTRCSVSPASAFAIATAAAGHGSPPPENTAVQEKFRRVSMGGKATAFYLSHLLRSVQFC